MDKICFCVTLPYTHLLVVISAFFKSFSLFARLINVLRCFQQYFSCIMATVHFIYVFSGFHEYKAGLLSVLPKDTPTKNPRGYSAAWTQDPWITSQTLYTEPHATSHFLHVIMRISCLCRTSCGYLNSSIALFGLLLLCLFSLSGKVRKALDPLDTCKYFL